MVSNGNGAQLYADFTARSCSSKYLFRCIYISSDAPSTARALCTSRNYSFCSHVLQPPWQTTSMDSLPDECVYSACICCYTCARAPRSHCAAWLGLSKWLGLSVPRAVHSVRQGAPHRVQGQAGLPVLLGAVAGGTSDTRPADRVSEGGGLVTAAAH